MYKSKAQDIFERLQAGIPLTFDSGYVQQKLGEELSRFKLAAKTEMPCNQPRPSTRPGKRKMVLACEGDKKRLIHFGDSKLGLHKENPKRKASYCARSAGITGGDGKLSANYWARKDWSC
jgi:hypothetical protein